MNIPRRPIGDGVETQFHQSVFDRLFGELKLIDSPTIKWTKTTRGIAGNVRAAAASGGGGTGLNPRGGWTTGEVYRKFDMVHVTERLSLPLNAFDVADIAALIPDPMPSFDLAFYSTWYWLHDNPTDTEPNANPHCPSVMADPLKDPPDWNMAVSPVGVPFFSGTFISQSGTDGAPQRPPDENRAWTLMNVCTLPINWGATRLIKFKDQAGVQHAMVFWNGQLIIDSY